MTPEERRELADRLVERADRIDLDIIERAIPTPEQADRAEEWSITLRRAALALREMPSTEEVVAAARASLWEQMESEAVERLTAEVARLRAGIEAHRRRVPTEQAAADRDLWALLDTEGGKT